MPFQKVIYDPSLTWKVAANLAAVPGEPGRYRWSNEGNSDEKMGASLHVSTKLITKIRIRNGWALHNEHFDKKRRRRARKPETVAKPVPVTVAPKAAPKPKPSPMIKITGDGEDIVMIPRKQIVDLVDRVNQLEQKHDSLLARLGG